MYQDLQMSKFLIFLGFLWAFPLSIVGWLLMGVLYLFRQVDMVCPGRDFMIYWDLKNDGFFSRKVMKGWRGFSVGCNIVLMDISSSYHRTMLHEQAHCKQQYKFGIFQPILYILDSLRIYMVCPDLHSYYDNVFEKGARRAAGQRVYIPKSMWRDGEHDRWIWW